MDKKLLINIVYLLFGIITIIGVVLSFTNYEFAYIPFGAGVLGLTIVKVTTFIRSDDFRIRRLQNIQILSTLMQIFAAYLMYKNNDIWVILLLLSSLFDLIVVIRSPKENDKK